MNTEQPTSKLDEQSETTLDIATLNQVTTQRYIYDQSKDNMSFFSRSKPKAYESWEDAYTDFVGGLFIRGLALGAAAMAVVAVIIAAIVYFVYR